jgi:hypothetical protein
MTKRGVLVVLDSMMFLCFIVLMSWRLSGVVAHEWIGLSLIAMIVTHLVVHWGWVEGSVARVARQRRRVGMTPLLLNSALFVTMGTALVSGIVISKVVFPNQLLPGDYLHWHSLHESASTITLFILGLHVALNWDRIRSSVRRLFDVSGRQSPFVWRVSPRVMARRAMWVTVVSAVLVLAVFAFARVVPSHAQVLMTFPDGHTALAGPPPGIAKIQRGSTMPNPMGAPKLVLSLVMLSIAAVVGRRVLRLRLTPRQSKRGLAG